MQRPKWGVGVNIIWVLLGGLTTFSAILVAFLFDAPGSEQNRYLVDVAIGLAASPVSFFVGAVAAFLSGRLRLWALALPLIPIGFVVYGFSMISAVCDGRFRCPAL
jgi:uncharacterized membrane protein YoaK (UPF0700 family)